MKSDPVGNLGRWFWYLVPANPILVRVVQGASRRMQHLWFRFGYLLVLFLVMLFFFSFENKQGALVDMAKASTQVFASVAWVQLLLMCFMAPVFTAGAITQEKDAETFNILLTTPLSNAQIIFGSLLSRLYFVLVLLLSGMPIFCITMIYGGVTMAQIVLSFAIAGSTAVITGSLAIMISMIRVGTRKTIFSFYLVIGLYLTVVYFLGTWNGTRVAEAVASADGSKYMSWLTPFHPFLALEVGLSEVPAPALADVAHYGWPTKYLLAYPHISYATMTLILSLLMIIFSMFFVRSGAKEGEPTWFNRLTGWTRRRAVNGAERRRKPHRVWANPVAWREAKTRASAASAGFARYALMIGGVGVSVVILLCLINGTIVTRDDGTTAAFGVADARQKLTWLLAAEIVVIFLVACNAAATSMTKERESNTMDILLTTPLTSKHIVWGKLRGLISFTVPLLAVPIVNLLIFVVYDVIQSVRGRSAEQVVNFEATIELAGMLLVFTALACVVGLQTSLKSNKTVRAVLVSVTIMTIVLGLVSVIGHSIVDSAGASGAVVAPFTPYTVVNFMTGQYGPEVYRTGPRITFLVCCCFAFGVYALVVGGMYKSLVRNFDMIVRKKTAS